MWKYPYTLHPYTLPYGDALVREDDHDEVIRPDHGQVVNCSTRFSTYGFPWLLTVQWRVLHRFPLERHEHGMFRRERPRWEAHTRPASGGLSEVDVLEARTVRRMKGRKQSRSTNPWMEYHHHKEPIVYSMCEITSMHGSVAYIFGQLLRFISG